jgi:prolyl 4-hydroxylase
LTLYAKQRIMASRFDYRTFLVFFPAWYPGDLQKMFDNIVSNPYYGEKYDITVLSRPYYAKDGTAEASNSQIGPWVMTLDNFLSEEEAERLIALGGAIGYERSTDVGEIEDDGSFERVVSQGRTSTNAWCNTDECNDDPVVNAVYERMSNLTQIPIVNSEPLQLLRYTPGQFYQSHHDYIEYEIKRKQGVRILTIFLYLNDVEAGGETDFPHLGLTVEPKLGRALIWPSVLNDDPNAADPRTQHQALAVKEGIKYGANAWLHQRGLDDCDL